ncbi:hypothetical protein B0A48_03711 [Cryoendolithus antarcticus]|uniref:Uncharacterized protein n=1 Tax=Cryoendolithus antarcticus TaxID=1507870 RepID=A0A1V8TGB3_9PEZI|nr:hypothetical protein B0A48_03711 [Cryoendolithus antarcticus]
MNPAPRCRIDRAANTTVQQVPKQERECLGEQIRANKLGWTITIAIVVVMISWALYKDLKYPEKKTTSEKDTRSEKNCSPNEESSVEGTETKAAYDDSLDYLVNEECCCRGFAPCSCEVNGGSCW